MDQLCQADKLPQIGWDGGEGCERERERETRLMGQKRLISYKTLVSTIRKGVFILN